MIRRILFILVCLGLALQGEAVRALEKQPCPMEAAMQTMLTAGDLDPTDLADCCNDLQTYAATGHLCKSGTDCNAPPAISPVSMPSTAVAAAASTGPEASPTSTHSAPTATPWRPPAGN
ncbi:hypothetical protein [Sphaerotilus sp.]|uniref:hypothetical protein n=1 Tax=Sphaerotilus sp. TaxID=2093942 RepID=UPI002ACD9E6A|nr:hypothetical protein [Sphaerotilus sp.]MDZ7855781.1 hypothetical protein [Sphaerotilus sp.]